MEFTRALVTGASTGIGRAMAVELAARGVALVLVARDGARLDRLAAVLVDEHRVEVEVLVADLTDEAGRLAVEQRVAEHPAVDLLVNNAGLGTTGDLAGASVAEVARMVELNVTALVRLTTVAAQVFGARGHGGICNVSSIAGFQPAPGSATYAATKAFVTSLSEAVHEELADRGVHVSAVCPGFTRTEFHARGDIPVDGIPGALWSTAEEVARAALDGVAANRAVVVPGAANRVLAGTSRALPTALTRRAVGSARGLLQR